MGKGQIGARGTRRGKRSRVLIFARPEVCVLAIAIGAILDAPAGRRMLPVSMNAMRGHYILGYAILGATGPYLPQFFRSARGLDDQSIGWVLAVSQLPVFFSPILLTYLADRHVSPRLLALATCAMAFGVASRALRVMPAGELLAEKSTK